MILCGVDWPGAVFLERGIRLNGGIRMEVRRDKVDPGDKRKKSLTIQPYIYSLLCHEINCVM